MKHLKISIVFWFLILLVFNLGEGHANDDLIPGWKKSPFAVQQPEPEVKKRGITGVFGPSNFWECILEEMPGTKNDVTATQVGIKCRNDFPKGMNTKISKKKSPIFGIKTAPECVIKHTKDVSSHRGAAFVQRACYELYHRE